MLPPQLHGLALTEARSGESARIEMARLHGKGIAAGEAAIGHYGADSLRAVLYVSRYPRRQDAAAQLARMAERIGPGSSGFGKHEKFVVAGTEVHRVTGYGQSHYFYARERDVVWLSAPQGHGRDMLAELLAIRPDSMPGAADTTASPPGDREP